MGPLLIGQIYLTTGYVPVFVFIGACSLMITVSVLLLAPGQRRLAVPADPEPGLPAAGLTASETA